jgi:hypothetical protein
MRGKLFVSSVGLAALLVSPLPAQRGLGLGRVGGAAGPVTGPANESGPAHGKAGPAGNDTPASGTQNGGKPVDVSTKVTDNAALSARLQPLLPSGETIAAAAAGFKTQGQFVAALHVAHNLNLPFDQLKAQILGGQHESLGKAIETLRPDLGSSTVKENVKLAERQAGADMKQPAGSHDAGAGGQVASNAALSARLTPLLPPGMTLADAAAGFKNQGQFIAALHVAHNLNIPFASLKTQMIAGDSLGDAIHKLKPQLDSGSVQASVQAADGQAQTDIQGSGSGEPKP